jgi:hypothetical protein
MLRGVRLSSLPPTPLTETMPSSAMTTTSEPPKSKNEPSPTKGPSKTVIAVAVVGLLIVPAVLLIAEIVREPAPASAPMSEPLKTTEQPALTPPPPPPAAPPQPVAVQPAVAQGSANSEIAQKLALSRSISATDPKRARDLLREVLQAEPNNEQALEDLARKMLIDENGPEARELSERCSTVNATNPFCAEVAQQTKAFPASLQGMTQMLDMCLKAKPNDTGCLYGKAHLSFMDGKAEDAEGFINRMDQASPDAAESQLAKGRLKAAGGAYADAVPLLQAACNQKHDQACQRLDLLKKEGF